MTPTGGLLRLDELTTLVGGTRLAGAGDLAALAARMAPALSAASLLADFGAQLSDPTWAARATEESYVHPNGFLKLAIPVDDDTRRLRIHRFPPGVLGDIHDHRWPFASVVLHGRLLNEQYRVSSDGLRHHRHVHRPSDDADSFSLTPVGEDRLDHCASQVLTPGAFYSLRHDVLHRAHAPLELTLTLVIEGVTVRRDTSVFAAEPRSIHHKRSPRLDVPALRLAVTELQHLARGADDRAEGPSPSA